MQLNYVYDGIDGVIWHDFSNVKKRFAALRYGYIYNNNISFGAEISRAEYLSLMSDTTMRGYAANVNIGGFSRFSLNKPKNFKLFAETSIFYNRGINYTYLSGVWGITRHVFNRFGVYIAPGLSICMFKNRINLDLMYKFSNLYLAYSGKSIFSWRLTYNFNFNRKENGEK